MYCICPTPNYLIYLIVGSSVGELVCVYARWLESLTFNSAFHNNALTSCYYQILIYMRGTWDFSDSCTVKFVGIQMHLTYRVFTWAAVDLYN